MPVLNFEGPIEGYVVNFLKRNSWRVERSLTWDDMLQEARLCYVRVCTNYPAVEDPKHFMALFKRCWSTQFTDLAYKDTKVKALVTEGFRSQDDGEDMPTFDTAGSLDNDGYFNMLVEQAPQEVMSVVNLLLTAPAEFLTSLGLSLSLSRNKKATANARINRALGLPTAFDAIGSVERYFSPD